MGYNELRKQFQESIAKVERVTRQYQTVKAEEEVRQKELMEQIQAELSTELGQPVTIGKLPVTSAPVRAINSGYRRDEIVARIIELKTQNFRWDQIAAKLNDGGFKPQKGESFNGPSVYQLFKATQSRVLPLSSQNEIATLPVSKPVIEGVRAAIHGRQKVG